MSHGSNATTGCASSPVKERRSMPCNTTNGSSSAEQRAGEERDDDDGPDLPGDEGALAAAPQAERREQGHQAVARGAADDEREHDRQGGEEAREHDRRDERDRRGRSWSTPSAGGRATWSGVVTVALGPAMSASDAATASGSAPGANFTSTVRGTSVSTNDSAFARSMSTQFERGE